MEAITEGKYDDFSILNLNTQQYDPDRVDPFYQDLNLTQVIDKLAVRWGKNVKDYFMYLPKTPEDAEYRRKIYGDVKNEAVYRALISYTENLAEVARLRGEKEKVWAPIQKAVWHIREVGAYCDAYDELEKNLEQAPLSSEGMRRFLEILKEILGNGGYRQILEKTRLLIKRIHELRFVITYDKDRISVIQGSLPDTDASVSDTQDGMHGGAVIKPAGRRKKQFLNPFRTEASLTELEQACLEILIEKNRDFFKEIKSTADSLENYAKNVLQRFEQEILFYLSFCTLQRDMEKEGFVFSTPDTGPGKAMKAEGLYDLALALTALNSGRKVVANDFYYGEGEHFFVLTGPNQGGKTTFARSLGQLVYFTRIGLDVPARSASLPFFSYIQTHFSVEESIETGRGKLKEELVRLAPMMDDHQKGTFVIINELFTTAASYDAQIMGKKVIEHFLGLDCMGIYVTHLKELANPREGVVSLRAMLNDQRVQTFRIARGEAEDTPCAENQVNKYRLTYEQLKERL